MRRQRRPDVTKRLRPAGTPDNSPPIHRWDTQRENQSSPVRDERSSPSSREHASPADARCGATSFAPPGLLGIMALQPTDESVGYGRNVPGGTKSQAHVDRLAQSLLAKSFRGELALTEHPRASNTTTVRRQIQSRDDPTNHRSPSKGRLTLQPPVRVHGVRHRAGAIISYESPKMAVINDIRHAERCGYVAIALPRDEPDSAKSRSYYL